MFPTPAIRRWSSKNALTGSLRPWASSMRCVAVNSGVNGSTPRRAARYASRATELKSRWPVPNRLGSTYTSRCSSSSSIRTRVWSGSTGGSCSSAPVIRRCTSRCRSPDSHRSRYLPWRSTRSTVAPSSSAATWAGSSGRVHLGSRISTDTIVRPSRWGASCRRIVSTSGSSGTPSTVVPAAPEPGPNPQMNERPGSSGAERPASQSSALAPTSASGPSRRRDR